MVNLLALKPKVLFFAMVAINCLMLFLLILDVDERFGIQYPYGVLIGTATLALDILLIVFIRKWPTQDRTGDPEFEMPMQGGQNLVALTDIFSIGIPVAVIAGVVFRDIYYLLSSLVGIVLVAWLRFVQLSQKS